MSEGSSNFELHPASKVKFDVLPQFLNTLHHRLGWLGMSVLMLPMLWWNWAGTKQQVFALFKGEILNEKLFSEPFNIAHTGALDQPTIQKWLFLYTLMAFFALPYVAVVGWLTDRTSRAVRLTFGLYVASLATFLLCLLCLPLSGLIQYVWSMGVTPRRIQGFVYVFAHALLVIGFVAWAFCKPERMTRVTRLALGLYVSFLVVCVFCGPMCVAAYALILIAFAAWVFWNSKREKAEAGTRPNGDIGREG